jgi:hypothetical protein
MQRNPKAYIRIRGATFDFKCYLGNGRPRVTGGGAEYEAQKRPQSDAATLFTGNALITMDVPVLFDGWGPPGDRHDIEPHVNRIYNLCRGSGRKPPPNFIASGPMPFSGTRFQMALPEELDDPKPIVGPGGTLFRQALVLKLIEFNDPTSIDYRARQKQGIGPAQSIDPPNSIKLDRRESLLEVAARYYSDPAMAYYIGEANGIEDLRKKLPVGTRLKMPPPDSYGIDPARRA